MRLFTRRRALAAFAVAAIAAHMTLRDAHALDERTAHDFAFEAIEGGPLPLARFAGKPLLVVNTASRCGFTGQYAGLQSLWESFGPRGVGIVGTPSGSFNQELATEAEVKDFCEVAFSVTFPMSEIVSVKGEGAHPFYAWAAQEAQAPSWNFNKYLIDGDGRMVRHYPSGVRPERIARDIDALLAGRLVN